MKVLAYAKLNLSLAVGGRRPDGYHEILSVVQTIDLADRLEVDLQSEGVAVESDLGLPPDRDLAGLAALSLLQAKRCGGGARIRVRKEIPVGAGLGGGSSDAAAVLWALDRLVPPRLPPSALRELAGRVGSDVPLFLEGGRIRIEGRGERISPLPPEATEWFLLVVPPHALATAAVYAHFDRLSDGGNRGMASPARLGTNDLEAAALDLCPELRPYGEQVRRVEGTYAGMSGSGGTFFAAFPSREPALRGAETLSRGFPRASVYVCRPTGSGHREEGDHAHRD